MKHFSVVVIGGGQAGLAAGFYLRRANLDFAIVDAAPAPGGSWQQMWPSLRLFSPTQYSSLPGWPMPSSGSALPGRDQVVDYLTRYEQRYDLSVDRGVSVAAVGPAGDRLEITTNTGTFTADHVISATGTWRRPFWPAVPGASTFLGRQLHTAQYAGPESFAGQRVLVVGGGNSGAQILAEVSTVAKTIWVTHHEPRFLPDEMDGRALFKIASPGGDHPGGIAVLGDIVMVPTVVDARRRGVLHAKPALAGLAPTGAFWPDGTAVTLDSIIWCTGFRPDTQHLAGMHLERSKGQIRTVAETGVLSEARLSVLGYGDWTGRASATVVGAGRTAKTTVARIAAVLSRL